MSAVLIISIFLLIVTSFAILRSKRSPSGRDAVYGHLPPPARGLFDGVGSEVKPARETTRSAGNSGERHAPALRERAAKGDFTALEEAHSTSDRALYREVLGAIVAQHFGDAEKLSALASYIIRRDTLRADRNFAEALITAWKTSPERISAPKMLRIAALSDDAGTYRSAVEALLEHWKEGRPPALTAEDLRRLIESEYWVLGADAKHSGAGFVLKETLADARRQLSATAAAATTARRAPHSHEAG